MEILAGVLTKTTIVVIAREIEEAAGIPKVISDLRKKFESLKGFLDDAREREDDDEVVKKWVSDIRDLSNEGQEFTEKHLHRIERHRKIQPGSWNAVKGYPMAVLDGMVTKRERSQIQNLTNQISGMTLKMKAYGIQNREAESTAATATATADIDPFPTNGEDERIIVGLDEDVKTIQYQLVSVESTKVIGICGVGGLGKTTLANEVFMSKRVAEHFEAIAWAFVGQDQSRVIGVLEQILLDLLRSINVNEEEEVQGENEITDVDARRENVVSGKIRQILIKKRCLVVLDDFQNPEMWDRLQNAFSSMKSKKSLSKLVLTTCDPGVLSRVDPQGFLHQLRFLTCEERWELFLKKTGSPVGKRIRAFMMKTAYFPIIKQCIGLPLTIHVLGGLWRRSSRLQRANIISWERRIQGNDDDQSILELEAEQVLCLSHTTLEPCLRSCLREMLDYPEGHVIPTEELFRRWTAADTIAQKCLDNLVDRSLIQVVDKDCGMIKSCQLHSVVRDFYTKLHHSDVERLTARIEEEVDPCKVLSRLAHIWWIWHSRFGWLYLGFVR